MALDPLPAPSELTRSDIVAAVQDRIADGASPNAAFVAVYAEIERAGQVEALARLHGAQLVGMLWRQWNGANRAGPVSRSGQQPIVYVRPALVGDRPDADPAILDAAEPRRVIDTSLLRKTSLLDCQYKLGDEWVTLRFMTRRQCLMAFGSYRSDALGFEHSAQYFRAIAEKLDETQHVGDVFDEPMLLRLFKICKPASRQIPLEVPTP